MIGLKSTLNVCNFLSSYPCPELIKKKKALLVECVNVLKNKVNNGWGGVGDEIVCVVKRARPISPGAQAVSNVLKVRRGDVRRAVIVRCRKPVRRPDGRVVRFDDNAAVADLRMKGWGKIVSLAPKVCPSRHHSRNPVHSEPFELIQGRMRIALIRAIEPTHISTSVPLFIVCVFFRERRWCEPLWETSGERPQMDW
ncbi:ribosomal protein L14 domain-containing protein [Lactarius indigo]|nr:ribosomal protein L14 domain-containing protein [Lactarius indigo]